MSNQQSSTPTDSLSSSETTPSDPTLPSHSDSYSSPTQTASSKSGSNDSGIVNYYFIFIGLALFVAFLATGAILRKRRRARAYASQHRRSALSRDLAQSGAARGWTYGGRDGFGLSALMRRDGRGRVEEREGLDERGEAPPPYKPRDEEEGCAGATGQTMVEFRGTGEVAVPMRTIGREEVGLKPPDYSEAVTREMTDEEERSAAGRGSSSSAAAAAATTPGGPERWT